MVDDFEDWVLVREHEDSGVHSASPEKVWKSLSEEQEAPLLESSEDVRSISPIAPKGRSETPQLQEAIRRAEVARKEADSLFEEMKRLQAEANAQRLRAEKADRRAQALVILAKTQQNKLRALKSVVAKDTMLTDLQRSVPGTRKEVLQRQMEEKRSGQNSSLYRAIKGRSQRHRDQRSGLRSIPRRRERSGRKSKKSGARSS
jgi:hypothetical protein